jgi:hypothetical protein
MRLLLFISALVAHTCPAPTAVVPTSLAQDGSAAPATAFPAVYLDTRAPTPVPGSTVVRVPAGSNLQTALNRAKPGDVIELANGATFSGNFVLPNKNTTSTNWIIIRPANMTGVPPEGSRMTPALAAAAQLPIILSTSNQGAFNTEMGAHHYRLVALEVSVPASVNNSGLIRLGSGTEPTLAQLPHDLVLDRMYIHGTPTGNNRRCVALNSASSAVIDSYVSDCHEHGSDSQAIAGWNGSGPFKIVNNYLEAASENVAFGGADPAIPGLIPSDIEIRHNHFFKPTSWKGQGWLVKNLFEIKNAQRVLVEGNVFENNWRDGQGGSAINLKSVNQGGSCSWCVARDITFRLNLIRNTGSGFVLTGYDAGRGVHVPMERVTITDNVVAGIDVPPTFDGDGRGFLINNNPVDLVLSHNTVVEPTNSAITFGGPANEPPVRLFFKDNIVGGGQYGVKGPGLTTAATFATFASTGVIFGNVFSVREPGGFPPGNFLARSLGAVGFVNPAAMDFRLSAGSPYRGRASDGRDPGADMTALSAAIAGVVVP